ncbi:Transposase DDE domain-containing protein [Paracoccus aminovorans]|uniref:Transposase DDE domain-containing protein n=1 Tax=Paracoccus aminovorans TaxID=34004 RepID=A0A1I3DVD8_9RHOB|nr:IS1182 family transposase [Paracoccus aminovorans]SFH90696.1 Transposase DDE domain-containing protein [Paracoccus aminovorans]
MIPRKYIYRCPAGEVLSYRSTVEQQGLQMRRYWTTACADCPLRNRCTTNIVRRISLDLSRFGAAPLIA